MGLDSRPPRSTSGIRERIAQRDRAPTGLSWSDPDSSRECERQISAWEITAREALAFAKQAWLMRHDFLAPVVPDACASGDDVVVFLHGLFANAGVLRPLRAAVTRDRRVHTAALSYPPGPGIAELAERLSRVVASLPRGARVHLVGHSVGGIVTRYFAQELGDPRVVQTISMASPFAGIPRARLLGFACARDIDPRSPVLEALRRGGSRASSIPHLSIIAGSDVIVPAPLEHVLPRGEVVVMRGRGHNTLLFDPAVAEIVAARVLARRDMAANRGGPVTGGDAASAA